ncbi:hypothetical protein UPYG_G00216410 [Umbra pygmaea]|uniref:Uncharacterized protein n=1 Tax=Umbra pygmaea TaxID=75934 RepID=A0ABD0WQW0_UMBPY
MRDHFSNEKGGGGRTGRLVLPERCSCPSLCLCVVTPLPHRLPHSRRGDGRTQRRHTNTDPLTGVPAEEIEPWIQSGCRRPAQLLGWTFLPVYVADRPRPVVSIADVQDEHVRSIRNGESGFHCLIFIGIHLECQPPYDNLSPSFWD